MCGRAHSFENCFIIPGALAISMQLDPASRVSSAFIIAFLLCSFSVHAQSVETAAAFDDYMKAAVRYDQFSGSVLLARDGVSVFSQSYGMANYELDAPNTVQTVFRIASITKQFTAVAIMQMHEQGKLNVGDPICKHLEQCPAAWRPITIRQLLTHTSGIQNYSSLPDWDELLAVKSYQHSDLVALFRDLPLQFEPGDKYEYSNSGYYLLGLILERASGKTYGQYLREKIFEPLGMTHSGYEESRSLIPNRASGYYSLGTSFINAPYMNPTVTYAAGGIHSNLGDLLLWDQALYSEKLLSRNSLEQMFTPFKNGYGYGWRIGEKHGRRETDHSGSLNGFSTYIMRFPAERVTVIVLSNSDRASAGRVGVDLSAIYFGAPYEVPSPKLREILWDLIVQKGVAAAIHDYRELKRSQAGTFDFGEATLVDLGYDLFEGQNLAAALEIFKLNLEGFPQSAFSYDGLADIAAAQGDKQKAVAYFEKSLSLDPKNRYAVDALARLRKGASK